MSPEAIPIAARNRLREMESQWGAPPGRPRKKSKSTTNFTNYSTNLRRNKHALQGRICTTLTKVRLSYQLRVRERAEKRNEEVPFSGFQALFGPCLGFAHQLNFYQARA